ncbi:DUF1707 domain-containing protein [uncultured Nocardioides sp.]|uniref:DUF1707 SHOCT-like domain-containing protein n=1 Tax=uncultured Nocardioides sp. TaxID=198441 RepID=UPI0026099DDC|nr:DUF1707 domain-containing protein [uncultured Nocardioides sp.]
MGQTKDAVAGPPAMRIGDAERDACVDVLAEHHVRGRLTLDELDRRQRLALTASTADDLAALLLDLPAEPASAGSARSPRSTWRAAVARAWGLRPVRALVLAPAGLAAGGGLVAVSHTNDDVWKFALGLGAAAVGFAANAGIGRRRRHDGDDGDDPGRRERP